MNHYIEFKFYSKANRDPDQLPIVPADNILARICLPFLCTKSPNIFCPKL